MAQEQPHIAWLEEDTVIKGFLHPLGEAAKQGDRNRIGKIFSIISRHIEDGLRLRDILKPDVNEADYLLCDTIQQKINDLRDAVKLRLQKPADDNENDDELRDGPPSNPVPIGGPSSSSAGAAIEIAAPLTKKRVSPRETIESHGYDVREIPDKRNRAA